jgi:outer membrane protein assembly factor BamB
MNIMSLKRTRFLLAAGALTAFLSSAMASDWPNWRGPDRNGISKETDWSAKFPEQGPKILWKANVGLGYSSFIVGDGRAYTAGHDNDNDTVFCFDAVSGKEIWKHSYPAELGDKSFPGGATGTPTLDGDSLYWLSRWGDLFCFEAKTGKILWQRNLQKDSNIPIPSWGFAGAPTVHENLLLLNVGEHGMALDKKSGKTLWLSPLKDSGYSTPLPLERDGKWFAVFTSGEAYIAADLATGKELWRMRWLTQYGVNASDPIVAGDEYLISTGYGKGAALFKASGSGEPEVIWKSRVLRTQQAPGVLINGFAYGVDGNAGSQANLKCIEFKTGQEKWAHPIGFGAVSAADNKLIVISAAGELMIAPASPDGFKPISQGQVLGANCWTVPVLANGIVYCRNSKGSVAAVDLRK